MSRHNPGTRDYLQPDAQAPVPGAAKSQAAKIVYLVHDLRDPAVERRVRMMRDGGILPAVLGFHRTMPPASVCGVPTIDLGRTANARLAQRAGTVLRTALGLARWKHQFEGATVIMARNLEMLLLAAIARRSFAPQASLVYECLDVHNVLVDEGPKGKALRAIERNLLRRCQLLIVSSPAFVSAHFNLRHTVVPPVMLLENKLLWSELPPCGLRRSGARTIPATRPWRIGWFGVIRCRTSLALLSQLCRARPNLVEVVIRGRVARNVLTDFDEVIAATPGMTFLGVYDRGRDLATIYGDVHYSWAIDFYEAGFNSEWLLPNRLYEGTSHGAIPLAFEGVQTGTWLAERKAGIVLAEPLAERLLAYFDTLDEEGYHEARAALARIPTADLVSDHTEAAQFANRLLTLSPAEAQGRKTRPASARDRLPVLPKPGDQDGLPAR